MKTEIDYGVGITNINIETGIRYGVIPANEIGQRWYEESEAHYIYSCPFCFKEFRDQDEIPNGCEWCSHELVELDFNEVEPMYFYIANGLLTAEQGGDDTDVFILDSEYYTWSQFCSPCAPGAGYILDWTDPDVGIKAYCPGHDWYEGGEAPYPVYDVATENLVNP